MTATTQPEARRITLPGKRVWLSISAFAIILLAIALAFRALNHHLPFFGLYQDDAIYVVTAKSLAEGHGYRILSLPGEPFQTKYPILYPLVLSVIWKTYPDFPHNLVAIES